MLFLVDASRGLLVIRLLDALHRNSGQRGAFFFFFANVSSCQRSAFVELVACLVVCFFVFAGCYSFFFIQLARGSSD